MNRQILLTVCIISALYSFAQTPKFEWAKSLGGNNQTSGQSIVIDAVGNIYTAGVFWGTTDFDPGPATHNLTSAGRNDVFISKLDANGNFVWVKQFAGGSDEYVTSIALDASGNIYTAGSFLNDTTDFDPGPGKFNLISKEYDIFISKLDANGNFVWAKKMGGDKYGNSYGMTLDPGGNVYITGEFSGTVDFDPGTGITNLTAVSLDIFIAKLDASGNFIWVKSLGHTYNSRPRSIAADASGNIYITGIFPYTFDFDPGPGTFYLTSKSWDIYVLKLNSSGSFVWAKNLGVGWGFSVAVDAKGNVYTTGDFEDTADFDPGTGTYNLIAKGNTDIFISKLDASGNFVWAKNMGGSLIEGGRSITSDASGNIYTTGYFTKTADFDPGSGTFNLTASDNYDIFISKLDASGNFVWAGKMGGVSVDLGNCIKLDAAGNIYTTGQFIDTVDFNPDPTAQFNMISSGPTYSAFIHKMSQKTIGIKDYPFSDSIKIYPNPTNGIINLESRNRNEAIHIRVLNSMGQIVMEENSIQHSQFNMQHLPAGLYYLKVTDEMGFTAFQKVVKN